jgi:hypothetical protein
VPVSREHDEAQWLPPADEPKAVAPSDDLKARALALYQGPFRYDKLGGYVWDARHEMVLDNRVKHPAVEVARIRGWGRIGYMADPHALQDAVGELVAQALTEFWAKAKQPADHSASCKSDDPACKGGCW